MTKRTNLRKSLIMAVFFFVMATGIAAGKVIYVDDDASLGGDGQTWATAYKFLQDALGAAVSGDEIIVAHGVYQPDEDSTHPDGTGLRTATFQLKNGVDIRGGYAGLGQPVPDTRDIELYETILSGDLRIIGSNWDNSYHVVTGNWTNETAILDGFTITGGNANGAGNNDDGGGMFNLYGSPKLINCTFRDNSAGFLGGGMFSYSEISPLLTNCTFINNSSTYGGGIYNGTWDWDTSRLKLMNCTFKDNSAAENGGAIDNSADTFLTIVNCIFTGNTAGHYGGGISSWLNSRQTLTDCTFNENEAVGNGGGMYNYGNELRLTNCTFSRNSTMVAGGGIHNNESSPTLTNCSFTENSAARAGGIRNRINSSPMLINCKFIGNLASENGGGVGNLNNGRPTLINCTFSGNRAVIQGGGVFNEMSSNSTLVNCILWGNTATIGPQIDNDGTSWATVSYSDVQGGWPGGGNINADPLFVNPAIGDYHLLLGSPCIDTGDNSAIPVSVITDFDGNPRIIDGTVDMGVYEGPYPCFLLSSESVVVPEGGTATFTVAPMVDPRGILEVTVAVESGDPDISIASGELLTFDSTNYSQPQTVTLAAIQDVDQVHGTTVILISAPGFHSASISAYEFDSEGPTILYVDCDARGKNDGSSWENAFQELRDGLSFAAETFWVKEILVAQGVYKPTGFRPPPPPPPPPPPFGFTSSQDEVGGDDAEATFQLINGKAIYGGYAGVGEPDPDARNIKAYETILSGDIEIPGDDSDNSYHVVTSRECGPNTILDGFTITSGNANGGFDIEGMISHWRFNEGQGSVAYDSAGNNHGAVHGAKWTTSQTGKALSFDGIDDYIEVADSTTLDCPGGITIVMWIKPDSGMNCNDNNNWRYIFRKGNYSWGAYNLVYEASWDVPLINFRVRRGAYSLVTASAAYPGIFNFLAFTYDALSGEQKTYFNGNLDSQIITDGDLISRNDGPLKIGGGYNTAVCPDGAGGFKGLIDDVAIYDRALSGEEIQRLFITTGENHKSGGGMFNRDSSPRINYCTFSANQAEQCGGGIYNESSSPILTNCRFNSNFSSRGGGITNEGCSNPTIVNCLFSGNTADNGGGMDNRTGSSPTLFNCTFTGNLAQESGGGMDNDQSSPALTNCILWNNKDKSGVGLSSQISGATILNYSCVQGYVEPINQGVISHWRFDEGQGSTAYDSFGNNDGTIYGALWVNGLFDGALDFDGINDYVNCGHDMSLNRTHEITIAAWIYPRYVYDEVILLSKGDTGCGNYKLFIKDRRLALLSSHSCSWNNTGYSSYISANQWQHISVTFNGSSIKYYIDGNLKNIVYRDGLGSSNNYDLKIGGPIIPGWNLTRYFNGIMDELRIYNRSLLAGEITQLYQYDSGENQGNSNTDPCFVSPGYWDSSDVWFEGDYHLLLDSPCINAGDPDYSIDPNETDLDGNPRVVGGRIDLGAYELLNTQPIADAGPDQTVECMCNTVEGTKVILDGTGSSDIDGDPLTYTWTGPFVESPANGATPTVTLENGCPGEYIITLVANDGTEDSEPDEVVITVVDTTPPVIVCPADVTLECPADTSVGANGLATATDNCDDSPEIVYGDMYYGTCPKVIERKWTATDAAGNSSSCVQVITVVDTTSPVINCPADVTLECPADISVEANGSATASDTCSSVTIVHSDAWQAGCGNTGTLMRTWTATDECGNSSSCVQVITVVDTTAPEFTLSVSPTVLWPANHKMVLITPSWTVSDKCDATPEVSLVSISVNEAYDAKGAGNTADDIQIGDGSIYLRAERSGAGNDRIYTITYKAVDDCGNVTESSAIVTVPHDQR